MILVVDDNPDACKMLTRYLRSEGFVAECAYSAAEALRVMRTRSPRLLILDHMMPDVNGLELLESIRRDPRLRHTHAVIYSGADGDAERGRANELGSAWLVKGAALEALIAHVRREYGMA